MRPLALRHAGFPARPAWNYRDRDHIWILGTPISNVEPSISKVTFDIEVFDIVCTFDIEGLRIRYRISISKVFDIEDYTLRYRIG